MTKAQLEVWADKWRGYLAIAPLNEKPDDKPFRGLPAPLLKLALEELKGEGGSIVDMNIDIYTLTRYGIVKLRGKPIANIAFWASGSDWKRLEETGAIQ